MIFDANKLLELAKREDGLDDFGPGPFGDDYPVFVSALNTSANIREDRAPDIEKYVVENCNE